MLLRFQYSTGTVKGSKQHFLHDKIPNARKDRISYPTTLREVVQKYDWMKITVEVLCGTGKKVHD